MLRHSIILILVSNSLFASAITPPPNNAMALSLGGASATSTNTFALENNIGALAFAKNQLAINMQNRFGLAEYSTLMLAGNYNLNHSVVGVSYCNASFANLNTQKVQVGFSRQLSEDLALGVGLNYYRFSSNHNYYKNANVFTFNAGLYYKINKLLNAGFSISNPERPLLIRETNERLPALFRFGADYLISDKVTIYADALQVSEENLQFNGGVEVEVQQLKIRGGFTTNQSLALGLGYTSKKFFVDFATQYHNQLGMSPSLNLGYAF